MIIVDEVSLPSRWKQRNWRHANQKKKKAITQPAKNFKIWTEYAEGGIFWMIDWNQQIK
jgi:hypothetical protein